MKKLRPLTDEERERIRLHLLMEDRVTRRATVHHFAREVGDHVDLAAVQEISNEMLFAGKN